MINQELFIRQLVQLNLKTLYNPLFYISDMAIPLPLSFSLCLSLIFISNPETILPFASSLCRAGYHLRKEMRNLPKDLSEKRSLKRSFPILDITRFPCLAAWLQDQRQVACKPMDRCSCQADRGRTNRQSGTCR